MLFTFGLPILVWFTSNCCFICQNPWFLLQNISSAYHCWFSLFVALESTHTICEWGGGEVSHGWKNISRMCTQNYSGAWLLRQAEAWCWVPVRPPFPQGTMYLSSADNSWVRPRNRDFNMTVNPATHMLNGCIHFRYHESTQIREYDQSLLP